MAWTTHADLAEAAAVVLTSDGPDGVTPPLVAARAVDMTGVAAVATELTDRPMRRVVVADEQYRSELLTRVPEPAVEMLMGFFLASRSGAFAATDPTLEHLLGRAPAALRDTLTSAAAPAHGSGSS